MNESGMFNTGFRDETVNTQDGPATDEAARLDRFMEQTRSEVEQVRARLNRQEDEREAHRNRGKIQAFILGLLILVLLGASWYAFPAVREMHQNAVDMLGLRGVADSMGKQIQALEGKLNQTAAGLPALSARMDQLGETMSSTLQNARNYAQAAAKQAGQQIQADVNRSIQSIQSSVAGLESNHQEARQRVDRLEQQITDLKDQVNSMRGQAAVTDQKLREFENGQETRDRKLSAIDDKIASNQEALDSVATRLKTERVDFEVQRRRTEEISPEIYLTVRSTNTDKQEVNGTLQLAADSYMLPIRAQEIRRPLRVYPSNESGPVELVFTGVTKDQVSGYVLRPDATTGLDATEAGRTDGTDR